jgi:hypothetical protein
MAARRNFSDLRNEINLSSPGSIKVISAVAVLGLGAGLFFFLPDNSDSEFPIASAAASAPEPASAPDESLCDKQAWPYVDQRCAKRVEAARGTRQVRIVTDKGHSVTAVTPLPIVEDKPTPAPAVAKADRPLGPPANPAAAEPAPQPQTVASAPQPAPQNSAPKQAAAPIPMAQVTVTPLRRPAATETTGETQNPSANERTAAVAPSAAVTAPPAPGFDAFASLPRNSRAARAAEKAAKREARREARRQKANEEGVPEDVVEAVKSLPAGGQNGRRARGVPDEVARAVEEATADGRRGRRVIVGSPNGGQRIYLVPREEASGGW